jgi:hypothetical protein
MEQNWLSEDERKILLALGHIGTVMALILTEQRQIAAQNQDIDADIDGLEKKVDELTKKVDKVLQSLPLPPGKMDLTFGTPKT